MMRYVISSVIVVVFISLIFSCKDASVSSSIEEPLIVEGTKISALAVRSINGPGQKLKNVAVGTSATCTSGLATANGPCCILVLGYYEHGDGGGGQFCYDPNATAADNGGTIITPSSNPLSGRWIRTVSGQINIRWFGAKGDGITPDQDAINQAIAAAYNVGGAEVYFPHGKYYVTSEISLEGYHQLNLTGAGRSRSVIFTTRDLRAVVSLIGSSYITMSNLAIASGNPNAPAKTALALGRSSSTASGGYHQFNNIEVGGYFSLAGIYSIASEVNSWRQLYAHVDGGGALYTFYTSQGDELGLGGSPAPQSSTNLTGWIDHSLLTNASSDSNAAVIYISAYASTGSWSVRDSTLAKNAGSVIRMATHADNQAAGPFTFSNLYAEEGTATGYGFYFEGIGTPTPSFSGLTIDSCMFALNGSNFIFSDDNCMIGNSQFRNNRSYIGSSIYAGSSNIITEPTMPHQFRRFLYDSFFFHGSSYDADVPALTGNSNIFFGKFGKFRLQLYDQGYLNGFASYTTTLELSSSTIPNGAVATQVVAWNGGYNVGATVIASLTPGAPAGIMMFASVTGGREITITVLNMTGSSWTPPSSTLRLDVWKHNN